MDEVQMKRDCVLVADDIDFGRGILKMLLRRDYDVLEAADGAQAIERLKEAPSRISCVLLDIKMPGVDGYGVMDYMRSEGLLEKIPVIALTSISDPQGHIRCYESGAIDLIEKPYDEEVLLYKIRWDIDRFRRLAAPAQSISPAPAGSPAQDGSGARPSPLDAVKDRCRRMFALETASEADDMAAAFMRTFGSCAERLRAQEHEPDFAAVRDVTHDMNGFASNSGADDLADLTLVLNTCAKAGSAAATSAAIRRVLALYDAYRA